MAGPKTPLGKKFAEWREDPRIFVREVFKVVPDPWQDDVLGAFPKRQRIAMKACKGPGKTAVLAWIVWNFLLTRPSPKIAATSISGDNLSDNLWAELAKWQQVSPLLRAMFEWTRTRIFAKEEPETWWASARTWPKSASADQQANTLAGLHADYILFVLDESGGIPDAVMASAEAALSSCVEGHLVQAGNPTNLEGPLYRASTSEKDLWFNVEITGDPDDPKRSTRVSAQWAREQIAKYGKDNPWVLVNVFGRFPPSSINALIGRDEVIEAMRRSYREYDLQNSATVLGIDVARQGDDASVIARRRGLQMFNMAKYRNLTGIEGASITNRLWQQHNVDGCFIDATGGFGWPWIEQLGVLGKTAVPVGFANDAANKDKYANKRAEMAFLFVDWIKNGGALPPENAEGSMELLEATARTTYTFLGDRLLIEPKEDIKARIGFSPDEFDACALTFAEPISPKVRSNRAVQHNVAVGGYRPFADIERISGQQPQGAVSAYDPFRVG